MGVASNYYKKCYNINMNDSYSIYCDESCHLENDGQDVMVLGGVWCNTSYKKEIYSRIRDIKEKHGIPKYTEMKWTKISNGNVGAYLDLVDYFFDNQSINFRCLVVPDKQELNHRKYKQTHNDWYYKMYFDMLKNIITKDFSYDIYLDIKDTIGGTRTALLKEILSNNVYDFDKKIIRRIQLVRSHEVELIQLADILMGAVMAENRGNTGSAAKIQVINKIKERSGITLTKSTLPSERKVNIFIWTSDWNK